MQGGGGGVWSGGHGQTHQSNLDCWDWGARDVCVHPSLSVLSPAPSALLLLLYPAWSCSRFLPSKREFVLDPVACFGFS